MQAYLDLMRTVYLTGNDKTDRTNTGTRSLFGQNMRFNLANGFPLLTTKKLHLKAIIYELLWFLSGSTNVKWLQQYGVTIWDEWADDSGTLGPIYGHQWRHWTGSDGQPIDQIAKLVANIKADPNSRRLLVCSWNLTDIPKMRLPPCHVLFQFYVANGKLSCQLYQRSADIFLGLPFNIASYSLLIHMLAAQTNLSVGEFIWSGGDCHIYHNHFEQVETQLLRHPKSLPKLVIKRLPDSIFDYLYEDFEIINYEPQAKIPASVAV